MLCTDCYVKTENFFKNNLKGNAPGDSNWLIAGFRREPHRLKGRTGTPAITGATGREYRHRKSFEKSPEKEFHVIFPLLRIRDPVSTLTSISYPFCKEPGLWKIHNDTQNR